MTKQGHYIIEFIQIGDYVKVSAVDPRSMVEVSIVGAPSAGEAALRQTAVRKLEYVIKKQRRAADDAKQGVSP